MDNNLSNHLAPSLVTRELQSALRQTIFSSGMQVSPRHANQIGNRFCDRYYAYWDDRQLEGCVAFGSELAAEGLGPKSVLAMTEALRTICWENSIVLEELPHVTGEFCNSLLEGFILGREAQLLEVQERTHQAFLVALERNQREDQESGS